MVTVKNLFCKKNIVKKCIFLGFKYVSLTLQWFLSKKTKTSCFRVMAIKHSYKVSGKVMSGLEENWKNESF